MCAPRRCPAVEVLLATSRFQRRPIRFKVISIEGNVPNKPDVEHSHLPEARLHYGLSGALSPRRWVAGSTNTPQSIALQQGGKYEVRGRVVNRSPSCGM